MYDRLLVKPTAHDLSASLAEAAGGDRAFWSERITELRDHREGRRSWPGRKAAVAWWTDHQGRRHFRVAGDAHLFGSDEWPPVVDLY
ncbi:MAG: hypothetical protein ACRC33_26970, partial [Gemmataceae bacterium]